jgi:hypothetical protein
VIEATVWFSSRTRTPSLASTAWCRPSDQRRPGIVRPVNSSTMMTSPLRTMYSTSAVDRMRAQRRVQVMHQPDVRRVVQALTLAEQARLGHQLLDAVVARLGEVHLLLLLVDREVARALLDSPASSGAARSC